MNRGHFFLEFPSGLISRVIPTIIISFYCLFCAVPVMALDPQIKGPIVSEPVIPGVSQEVASLPVHQPMRGVSYPIREAPRRRGKSMTGGNGEAGVGEPIGTGYPLQGHQEEAVRTSSRGLQSSSSIGISFDGMDIEDGGFAIPPDPVGDVGPNHYVQMVNTAFAIFDKQGNRLVGPLPINRLWQGQGNPCENYNDGDPIVLYDRLADRWLLSQFAVRQDAPYYECIAISQTPDPTGAYFLYAFSTEESFPDYPKLGVWPDAYYMSTNEGDLVGIYAFERDKMLNGQAAVFQKFEVQRNFMLPSDLDGSNPPPSGSPNYFYTMMDDTFWPSQGFPGEDRIEIWEFHVDFKNPANSTFTLTSSLPTESFDYLVCDFFDFDCIPQKGTSQRLDAIAEWPMFRFQYRNFGTHETLLGNFTVEMDDFTGHAGIRWFELRKTEEDDWHIYQEGTHAPDAHHRWMGSIAMNGEGNIALGYSVSSETLYPAIRYATQYYWDPVGSLRNETSLVESTASQPRFNRWGDYSSMNIDPVDDTTFWYTTEYLSESGYWKTRISSIKLRGSIFMFPPPRQ